MFFWVVLGSLVSVLAWGKFGETAKAPDDYVVPVYEAMVASLTQQNKMAVEYAQKKIMLYERNNKAKIDNMPPSTPSHSGFMFSIGPDGKVDGSTNPELGSNGVYHLNAYQYLKMADGFKSAYFCVYPNAGETIVPTSVANDTLCDYKTNDPAVVLVITYGQVPYRYTTKTMHHIFQAVDRTEPGSKMVGFVKRLNRESDGTFKIHTGEQDSSNTVYRVYAQGVGDKNALYLPKGVVEYIKGSDNVPNLEKYMVAVEILKYKNASCAVRWRQCL